jgi:hypothetical protein
MQAHDREAVETQNASGNIHHPAHIRSAGDGTVKTGFDQIPGKAGAGQSENGTHKGSPPEKIVG